MERQSAKKVFFGATGRGQESPKDKQTGGVGVRRYGSPPVCAVSQNPLRSKHFRTPPCRLYAQLTHESEEKNNPKLSKIGF